ncbi:MAG: hypothetical protein M1336_06695 [Deltaproteobacteria bacterium]|jgi:hypothetical protein|nr:hypothetical protein [Deltaproteobacteria bacterium]
MQWENTEFGGLFLPDSLTPEQFFDGRRADGTARPFKRLMLAVLEDALRCFQNNAGAAGGARRRQFTEVERWFSAEGEEGPFAFENVCEALGIEPGFLRGGLYRWRAEQLAGNRSRRLARRSPVVRRTRLALPNAPRARGRG